MKKLAVFLMVLSAGMFTLGCGGDTKKKDDKAKPAAAEKDKEKDKEKPAEPAK